MNALVMAYSAVVYLAFLAIFNYLVLFVGGDFLSAWVPPLAELKTVDSGLVALAIPGAPVWLSNLVLLLAFALQHSVMARLGFKKLITRLLPESAERSTYVLMTCLALGWMFIAWQPMTGVVWQIEGAAALLIQLLFLAGAGLVLWATFMISHTHLFGLAQAWQAFRGQSVDEADELIEPAMYKYSRHPMYLGILMVLWCTPTMSTGHLLMAAVWSVYVFIGIGYEERDLLDKFGDQYADYMRRVPQLLPLGRKA